MKKAIALAMASVMTAGLLAGCGGSAANSTAASSEAASSEAASTSTEAATEAHTVNTTDPITLTISWWGGDARQAAYEAACKAFTEKYPNITVECTIPEHLQLRYPQGCVHCYFFCHCCLRFQPFQVQGPRFPVRRYDHDAVPAAGCSERSSVHDVQQV